MIVCVSANPAIDRRLRIKNLNIGAINRAVSVEAFAGGKAAHVAMGTGVGKFTDFVCPMMCSEKFIVRTR